MTAPGMTVQIEFWELLTFFISLLLSFLGFAFLAGRQQRQFLGPPLQLAGANPCLGHAIRCEADFK